MRRTDEAGWVHAMRENGCEVAVVDLRLGGEEYRRALAVLSEQERARAREMRSQAKRRRFVAARAAVRRRLARELGIAVERVVLRVSEGGKPELDRVGAMGGSPSFSLSHSGDLAAIAIRRGGEVGVDVERVRAKGRADGRQVDWQRLLERICGEAEREQAREEAEKVGARVAFHERWVAKEAVVKALGCGLRIAPARVMLGRDSGMLTFEGVCGWQDAQARCRLVPFEAPRGFLGALALLDGPSVDPGNLLAG